MGKHDPVRKLSTPQAVVYGSLAGAIVWLLIILQAWAGWQVFG